MSRLRRGALVVALASLAACGSGNPDALTNPNLEQSAADENADLNAEDMGDTDAAAAAPSNETAAPVAADNAAVDRADEAANVTDEPDEPATEVGNVTDDENESTEPPEL